jgi:hypothetical protein
MSKPTNKLKTLKDFEDEMRSISLKSAKIMYEPDEYKFIKDNVTIDVSVPSSVLRKEAKKWIEANEEALKNIDTMKDRPASEYSYVGMSAVNKFIRHFFNLEDDTECVK